MQVVLLGGSSGKKRPSNYQERTFLEYYCFLPNPHSSDFTFIVYYETHWFNESSDLVVPVPNQPSPCLTVWQKVVIGGWKKGKAEKGAYCVGGDTNQPNDIFHYSGLPGWNMSWQFKWINFCEEVLVISFELYTVFYLYLLSSVTAKCHWLQDSFTNSVKLLYVIFLCRRPNFTFECAV